MTFMGSERIRALAVLDGKLWTAGPATVANWDGGTWTTLCDTYDGGSIYTICAHDGDIYVGGYFTALAGVPIDLAQVKTPSYFLSTREDHIAPWTSTYAGTQIFSGPKRFVLAASGHIAGVINPPAAGKYSHWVNTKVPKTPYAWLKESEEVTGSWWPDWDKWLARKSGPKVKARKPGAGKLKAMHRGPDARPAECAAIARRQPGSGDAGTVRRRTSAHLRMPGR